MLALLADKKPPLVFTPGSRFEYCNTNYTTLASVIAKISGMSCDSFFAAKIVKPLNLTNTYIYNYYHENLSRPRGCLVFIMQKENQ